MNIYLLIILVTLIGTYILGMISKYLNIKNMTAILPSEFQAFFDEEKYKKSQEYTLVKSYFSIITNTFSLIVILVMILMGGFGWLDRLIRESKNNELVNGLLFFGAIFIANELLSLPFSIYYTFSIEERFGFNRTTVKTFIFDHIKGYLLSIIIGCPALLAILLFLEHAGPFAWVYCWGFVILFSVIIGYIAPSWIMPLFNRFIPLEEGELKKALSEMANKAGFPIQGIYVMDGSKRSTKSNAFFTGFWRKKRIVLFDTLIAKHTVPELVSILAHEIGHYKKKHLLKGTLLGIAESGVLFYLLSIFLTHQGLFDAFHVEKISNYAGLLFFTMLYSPVSFILSIFGSWLSRKFEYEADRFEVEITGDKDSSVLSLKKMASEHLVNLTPHPFHVFLNYSHPPDLERIKAIQEISLQGNRG